MSSIPCYRAAHLRPYLDLLRDTGAPLERGLRQAGLPTLVAGGADIYLPQLPTLEFLNNMVGREGIDEIPLRALGQASIFRSQRAVPRQGELCANPEGCPGELPRPGAC